MAPSHLLILILVAASPLMLTSESTQQFTVGGPAGWTVPSPDHNPGFYNHWAKHTPFHVGDSLNFKYKNDSVLVVSHDDYKQCITSNPIMKFTDGNTFFGFDRLGLFYFISGEAGHCAAGQRMIVLVVVQSEAVSPWGAPPSSAASFVYASAPAYFAGLLSTLFFV